MFTEAIKIKYCNNLGSKV